MDYHICEWMREASNHYERQTGKRADYGYFLTNEGWRFCAGLINDKFGERRCRFCGEELTQTPSNQVIIE